MFTQILKDTLRSSGKNQKELAEFVGVRQNTVSDWINQGNSPKIEHIYRISEFFNISIDYLFGLTDDPTPPKSKIYEQNNNLAKNWDQLSQKQQSIITNLIEDFKEINSSLKTHTIKSLEDSLKSTNEK